MSARIELLLLFWSEGRNVPRPKMLLQLGELLPPQVALFLVGVLRPVLWQSFSFGPCFERIVSEMSRCGHGKRPNAQHQRWEPAASDARIGTELNDWLPSAACCGWAAYPKKPLDDYVPRVYGMSHEDI